MNLRATLARQAAAFLVPGEELHAAFRTQSCFGVHEALATGRPLWHLIADTNRAILVLDLSLVTRRPSQVRLRDHRYVYFGRARRFSFGYTFYWVSSDFNDEIAAADAALVDLLRFGDPPVEEVQLVGHNN